jgi:hypothetical protein
MQAPFVHFDIERHDSSPACSWAEMDPAARALANQPVPSSLSCGLYVQQALGRARVDESRSFGFAAMVAEVPRNLTTR